MKLYIRLIFFASLLSIGSIIFLFYNCEAAMASPTLIPPHDSGITMNTINIHKSGSVISQGGFLFYSDNPEYVHESDLADNGCWLNKAQVSGNGQVYIWHCNATDRAIHSELNITNPSNKKSILIETNQYALTNGYNSTDVAAWNSYLGSGKYKISILLRPGNSIQLFMQSVAQNNNFGIVAALKITDTNGNPGKAILEDRAYYEILGDVKYTGYDGTGRVRGVGSSYQNAITFDPVIMTKNNYFTYSIGAADDSLDGKDLVNIYDYATNNTSMLAGNYGEIMTINIPIKNNYKYNQNFGIYIGSIGGYSFPFVKLTENSFVSSPVKPFSAYDMIQTGKMAFGSSETVSFTVVIPALSSTPLIIGVHPIE